MKILHVINSFSGLGGAEIALARLVNAMPEHEHRLLSLMETSTDNQDLLQCASVLLEPVGIESAAGIYTAVRHLREVVSQEQPHIILGWMYMANAVCAMAKGFSSEFPPVVWSIHHALDDLKNESLATRMSITACRWLQSRCAHIVYVGHRVREQHEACGFRQNNGSVISHAVSMPIDCLRDNYCGNRVGIVARWHGAKGWPSMINVIAAVQKINSDTVFCFAGAGISSDNAELMSMLSTCEVDLDRVRLLGQISDVENFLQKIDFLLIGSRTEAGPIVLLEAMANGVVPITTDVGDARFIVNNDTLVTAVGDDNAMVERLLALLADMPECERIALECQQRIEQTFTMLKQVDAYSSLLGTIVSY